MRVGADPIGSRGVGDGRVQARARAGIELTLVLGVYLLYKAVRYLVRDDVRDAYQNAREVIGLERGLGAFAEPDIQSLFLSWQPSIEALNWFYARVHLISTVVVLVLLFVIDPKTYLWLRRRLLWLTVVAMVVHLLYPLAPPRLVSATGMVDTLQQFGPAIYKRGSALSRVTNPHAAMPSLHFGYAVLLAWALIRSSRVPVGKWLWLHPSLMLVAIVATANHYWLDAAVCAGLIGLVDMALRARQRAGDRRGMLQGGREVLDCYPSLPTPEPSCLLSPPI